MTEDITTHISWSHHREKAALEYRLANEQYNSASVRMDSAKIKERHYETCTAAFEYLASGVMFKKFGNLTERERDIVIAASQYVVFGRIL